MDIRRLEQVCIEDKFSRNNIRDKVMKDMETGLDAPMAIAVEDLKAYFNKSYYMSKNERLDAYEDVCGLSLEDLVNEICIIILPLTGAVSIQSVVGRLAEVLSYPNIFDGVKTAAEIITVACGSDLYDLIPARDSETGSIMVKSNFKLEESTLQYLAATKYLPPLICEPMPIDNNYHSPYLNKEESVLLGKGNHHDKPLGLDALNIASGVKLALDPWVLTQDEESTKPLDTIEKGLNFARMKIASKAVYQDLVNSGNEFFFGWKFDKRGRMYSSGYHVNIQSTEYKKSLINLATPQLIRKD